MSRRPFDRVMVHVGAGQSLKLRTLTDSEWRCFIGGVLPIAQLATIRGCLLVGESPATAEDIAHQAGVKPAVGRTALVKLRKLGIVYMDPELECERVHDFEDWNPPPKKDPTAAERARRYRERLRNARDNAVRHAVTSRPVTPPNGPEGEGEREEDGSVRGGRSSRRVSTQRPPLIPMAGGRG